MTSLLISSYCVFGIHCFLRELTHVNKQFQCSRLSSWSDRKKLWPSHRWNINRTSNYSMKLNPNKTSLKSKDDLSARNSQDHSFNNSVDNFRQARWIHGSWEMLRGSAWPRNIGSVVSSARFWEVRTCSRFTNVYAHAHMNVCLYVSYVYPPTPANNRGSASGKKPCSGVAQQSF
jgi:hypothetical protein